jgi:hypothetical protein
MQDRRARGLPGDVNAFVDAYLGDERKIAVADAEGV